MRPSLLCAIVALSLLCVAAAALAADNLRLATGLSFSDDSSSNFPIVGDDLGDGDVGRGRAALIFIGASHCWNTNREAERVVALYPRFRDRMSFVIIDADHPSDAQRPLLAAHYRGLIPTLVVLTPSGAVAYERAGETVSTRGDTRALEALLSKALSD
jgi:hypothetical protein